MVNVIKTCPIDSKEKTANLFRQVTRIVERGSGTVSGGHVIWRAYHVGDMSRGDGEEPRPGEERAQ